MSASSAAPRRSRRDSSPPTVRSTLVIGQRSRDGRQRGDQLLVERRLEVGPSAGRERRSPVAAGRRAAA